MPTNLGIANQALQLLKANTITSVTSDSTPEGILVSENFDDIRDAVLEENDWTFATQRYILPADATAPAYDYSKRYLIPDEVIRVVNVNGNMIGKYWAREGQYILTNYGTCKTKCIVKVTNPNLFSPMFVQALVYRLAWKLAVPIKGTTAKDQYKQDYIDLMLNAQTMDGMQGMHETRGRGRFVEARFSAGSNSYLGPEV